MMPLKILIVYLKCMPLSSLSVLFTDDGSMKHQQRTYIKEEVIISDLYNDYG